MPRKLKCHGLPMVIAINLFPANPTPRLDASSRRRFPTRDTVECTISTDKKIEIKEVELTHQAMMALCYMAAQRIITGEGWVHSDKLCVCRAGDEATKLIRRIRAQFEEVLGVELTFENNMAKCYRIGLDADVISFTVSNLAAVDHVQVEALIRNVMMKRPDAVNGAHVVGRTGATPSAGPNLNKGMETA